MSWFKSWKFNFNNLDPDAMRLINEKEETYIHQTLAKKRRGESFKGHAQDVWYTKNENNEKGAITSYNHYFSGSVGQTYSIDNHKTTRHYHATGRTPKWLNQKLNKLGSELGGNLSLAYAWTMLIEDNPKISIYGDDWNLTYSTSHDGFNFANHRENINELKQLQLLYRRLRNNIKNNDIASLIKECTLCGENVLKLNKDYLL